MAGEVRAKMVAGAMQLLARQGLQSTSFSEVLALTGAPRGSVYHHFPDGKEQLVTAAIDHASALALAYVERAAGGDAEQITRRFFAMWHGVLEHSRLTAGCAVLAVAVAADTDTLLEHAASIFRGWRARLTELLVDGGLAQADAVRFATTLIAAAEGAVVLSRAERSLEPLELVADELAAQVRRLARGSVAGD
ncbi:MAG TPA: TetR/AcrR family transcriptional regulator [Candidatus Sulfotelmatobacter sp.]|nr:TetR/AcrR family transcriptional regulator [Candidatus Sulfotelmatobacter sp.]